MESAPLTLDSRIKQQQDLDRVTWRGIDVQKIGRIGEGLNKKTLSDYLQKTLEKFKKTLSTPEYFPSYLYFVPVCESQLVKCSTPSNSFSKGRLLNSKHLLYKVQKADAKLVRSILELAGFGYTDSHDWNIMWLGCNAKLYLYEGLNANQRINHFPNSYEITRKDRMCYNLRSMQKKFGIEEYGFFPETFVLPKEYNDFCLRYRQDKETKWIVKPANSSQGRGIYILDNILSLRTSDECVVSRFIHNPLLINDLKFDLRIYVLVTSFEPLKIYVYDEGLARFASEKYSMFSKSNKYSFLTNYSINKKNENFVQNEDLDVDNIGHKWSLSALMRYLKLSNVDTDVITNKIYDMIIKTIITAENTVVTLVRKYNLSRSNCFDLFGFDIILDSQLKPWLLEVNLSPSLATDSPLDLNIKGNLVSELFNLIGVKNYDRRTESARQSRLNTAVSRPQTAKIVDQDEKYNEIFKETVAEFLRAKHFVRVYPCEGCQIYDKYFNVPRKINRALLNYLFATTTHLTAVPVSLTEQDLLIEYLSRLISTSDQIVFIQKWEDSIKEFNDHDVWRRIGLKTTDNGFLNRLNEIYSELKRRNDRYLQDSDKIEKKEGVLKRMSSLELEEALKGRKNELSSIVGCFFKESQGLLSQMQNLASQTPKRAYLDLKDVIFKHKHLQ